MNELVKSCLEKGFLIDVNLASLLKELYVVDKELCLTLLDILQDIKKEKILTKEIFSKHLPKIFIILNNQIIKKRKEPLVRNFLDILKRNFLISEETDFIKGVEKREKEKITKIKTRADEYKELGVEIIHSYELPTRKITIEDFVKHYSNRFLLFKNFLQEHNELQNLISINKISQQKQNISIIGLVYDKKWTKNKNLLLEVEDLTGRITLLVNSSKEEIFKKAKDILLDDIVGFRCTGNREILFVNDIIFPETKNLFLKRAPIEVYTTFTSDLHIGSTKFLEKNFKKFVKWLNAEIGSEKQKEIASKVKYLFITGDAVDGIGVFPGQEDFLDILDIKQQYEKLAQLLSEIRKDINIILCPGQHDCVRVAEPQPPLDKKIAEALYKLPNLFLVSNPAWVNIAATKNFSGFNVLMYHGASFHSFINDIEELRFANAHHNPSKVIKYVLQKRHLAPTHSSVVYIPSEKQDPLTIHSIPDIITTGDLHRPEIANYNNIISIQSSCWQSITPFEEKVGNEPDPCKVPILNLKTGQINIIDFS
jgi:DNA polymerase II small subunit